MLFYLKNRNKVRLKKRNFKKIIQPLYNRLTEKGHSYDKQDLRYHAFKVNAL